MGVLNEKRCNTRNCVKLNAINEYLQSTDENVNVTMFRGNRIVSDEDADEEEILYGEEGEDGEDRQLSNITLFRGNRIVSDEDTDEEETMYSEEGEDGEEIQLSNVTMFRGNRIMTDEDSDEEDFLLRNSN
jgi:hypothetical protein